MIPRAMDSLDLVEIVMVIEEVFGPDIPTIDTERFHSPREIVNWLELHLSNTRPNRQAAAMLRGVAKKRNWPELAEGLSGTWRREQIAAIIRELFRDE